MACAAAVVAGCSGSGAFQEHYDQGVAYLDRGRHKEAAQELAQALEADPESVDTRIKLGDAYTGTGQFDDALEVTLGIFTVADPADLTGGQLAVSYRRIAVINLRKAWASKDTAGLQRASSFFDKWREASNDFGAHLGKGLCLLGLKRYFRVAGGRDNAWERLAEAEKVDPASAAASYYRALAGDRSGQIAAGEVAALYREALQKAQLAKSKGTDGGPFPEAPAFHRNYVVESLTGLLDLLRRSPTAAATDEASAKKEGEALVQQLLAAGGTVPRAIESWLGQTGSGTVGPTGPGPGPTSTQKPPEIVTAPWGADRVEPAGLPFKFTLLTQGEAEPTQLEVRLDGALIAPSVDAKKLPVAVVNDETRFNTEFAVAFLLEPGDHTLTIRALDARGGRTLVPWQAKLRGRTPRKSLVIVGRDGAGASGAEADARAVAAALGDRLDVAADRRAVLIGADATPDAVVSAIGRLAGDAAPTDSLWVYVAGAGGADGASTPALALGGGDAGPTWLSLPRLARAVRSAAVGRAWLFIDAGFAGEGGRRVGDAAALDPPALLAAMAVDGTHRALLLGAQAGTAAERPGDEPRGLLTAALVDALGDPAADLDGDGQLSAGELAGYCADLTAFRAASHGVAQDPAAVGDPDLPVAPAAGR